MAVERIEEYRQKDGTDVLKIILKPTSKFRDGYFYCDAEDIDLVKLYTWYLTKEHDTSYVSCHMYEVKARFHQELAKKKLGYYLTYIDHKNHIGFDNCDINLFSVTATENNQNKNVRGYSCYTDTYSYLRWIVQVYYASGSYSRLTSNELEACKLRYCLEQKYYHNSYSFILDRSQSLDLLDLERTGQISAEEATYRHVLKYADNAWYYYRYGLEEYFRDNHIPVPSYALDELGYMIHPVTGQKLCPAKK